MSHLPNTTNTPPGGWRYTVPETQYKTPGYSSWPQLRGILQSHYTAAGYSVPDGLFEKVEAQICEAHPDYCCNDPTLVQRFVSGAKSISHTFHTALSCMATLMSNRAGSGERPTQILADARAAVCAACPENGDIEPCNHCNINTLNRLIEKLVGAHKTSSDASLKFCQVCHCNLRAKVWTKHEAIWNHMKDKTKARLPETCWLKTEIGRTP